jgi:CheY-like chemotaxis protein
MHPNIAVVVDLDAKGVSVSADPALLQSAIMNLLINARDAMPNGGRLTLRSRLERSGDPSTETPEAGAKVLLEVSDTGHGMTSEVRARAFDPFFTTKPPGQGTGLGLSAVAGTIESHGGSIDVDTRVGVGTTFRVRLPPMVKPELAVVTDESVLPKSSAEILVVDDEASVRHAAGALLSSFGYKVTLAEDGDHAIKLVQSSPKPFELVVLDSKMPGISREATFQAVRRAWPDVPVLFWSGRAADEALDQLLRNDKTSFLQKPYRAADLAQRVHDMVVGQSDVGGHSDRSA